MTGCHDSVAMKMSLFDLVGGRVIGSIAVGGGGWRGGCWRDGCWLGVEVVVGSVVAVWAGWRPRGDAKETRWRAWWNSHR